MGRHSRKSALCSLAILGIALGGTLAVPTAANADIWCTLFGAGCDDGGRNTSSATERNVPEIDHGALANAIALAAGGAAILRDRVRRRR